MNSNPMPFWKQPYIYVATAVVAIVVVIFVQSAKPSPYELEARKYSEAVIRCEYWAERQENSFKDDVNFAAYSEFVMKNAKEHLHKMGAIRITEKEY